MSQILLADKNIFDKSMDFKEGIINYSVMGSETGTKTIYIKEYGKIQVIHISTKSKFMRTTDAITYITPHWIYEIDLETKKTSKLPNLKYLLSQRFKKLAKKEKELLVENLKALKKRAIINLTNDIEFKETKILDYLCTIESINGIKTYTAQKSDIILKTEAKILGFKSTTIATNIEKKPLAQTIFILPPNLSIIETKAKQKALNQKADKIIKYLLSSNLKKEHLTFNKEVQEQNLQNIIQESIETLEAL